MDDTLLIESFRAGKGTAYDTVYRLFIKGLFIFADHLVHDTQVAQDLAVQALAKCFERNQDFESISKLKSFLFTTVNNAALNHIKIKKRHQEAHVEIKYLRGEMDDIELNYIRAEVVQAVNQAINALPPQLQQVIRLAFIEGKKLTEVAAEMELSYNTVQNYRARGLELVKLHLITNKWLSVAGLSLAFSLLEKN